jgi:hypothetical protein
LFLEVFMDKSVCLDVFQVGMAVFFSVFGKHRFLSVEFIFDCLGSMSVWMTLDFGVSEKFVCVFLKYRC